MTTTIALETSKGNLALSLALGLLLMVLVLTINAIAMLVQDTQSASIAKGGPCARCHAPGPVNRKAPIMLPLIVRDLCFDVSGKRLLDSITFHTDQGPRTVILGPNGAGKSLLLRLCHGLLQPSSGVITWAGAAPSVMRRQQAMVFQRPVLLRRSVAANIRYGLSVQGVPRRQRRAMVAAALEQAGLLHLAECSARVLSGGEQQRLALARAWALKPQVLFLDEPTASLDPAATQAVEALLEHIHHAGTKILMTTHDLGQARRLADEVLFLHHGRLVEYAPAATFFNNPQSKEAAAFLEGQLLW